MRFIRTGCLIIVLAVLVACSSQPAPTATPSPTETPSATGHIVLADISDEPAEIIEAFQPLADYLAAGLNEFGIGVGEVKIAPDTETMIAWLQSGEVHLYFDSPYPAMIISEASGAQPILRRWKDGVEEYHSVFFTQADSGIETVDDLQGKIIAFEEVFSTSGYMLPLVYLVEAGLSVVEVSDTDAEVGDDEVGYIFTNDEDTTLQWVVSGRVAAGTTDHVTYGGLPEETRDALVVFAETEDLPRHITIAQGDLEPDMLEAIKTLLINLDETDEGRSVLQAFEETARFDEFPDGAETALARMRELYNIASGQ